MLTDIIFGLAIALVSACFAYHAGKRAAFDLIKSHVDSTCSYEKAYEYELDVFEGRVPRG